MPNFSFALAKVFQVVVLPEPGGPIKNTQWRISKSSESCTIFKIKLEFGVSLSSSVADLIDSSKWISTFLGITIFGNKSLSNPSKIPKSTAAIFG